jgi:hypothetical protein
MIYTAPYIMVLMQADPIQVQVGGDWAKSLPTCPGIGLGGLGADTHVRYCNCGPANKKTGLINAGNYLKCKLAGQHHLSRVFRIRDILVRIRMWILGSAPLTNGSGCGSGSVSKSSVTFRMQKN